MYRGHEELAQWYSEFLSQWESLESVPGEITELGADRLMVVETWRARGATSGVDVEELRLPFTVVEGQSLLALLLDQGRGPRSRPAARRGDLAEGHRHAPRCDGGTCG